MKRVVVTGATGFVGANLARRLLRDGHQVHLLVRARGDHWRIRGIQTQAHLHHVDLGDRAAVAGVIERVRPDWVFHLAAYGAYSSQTDARRMVDTNLLATMNLVEACLQTGFEAFINTGSSSEYGFKTQAPAEDTWLEPNSYYALTKASATHYCRYIAQTQRVPVTTLRLYSVYGPYEEPTRLMPTLILKGLEGTLPPLVNPAIARDYVYAEDVNDAYLLAATRPSPEKGAVYNLGTGVQTSLADVVAVARRVLGIVEEPKWGTMPDRAWDTTVWVADNRKICRELGWQPRHTFEQGFARMVDWLRSHAALYRPATDGLARAS